MSCDTKPLAGEYGELSSSLCSYLYAKLVLDNFVIGFKFQLNL